MICNTKGEREEEWKKLLLLLLRGRVKGKNGKGGSWWGWGKLEDKKLLSIFEWLSNHSFFFVFELS